MSRTIVIDTVDHGPVVLDEPAWCIGHGREIGREVYRNDITHNSARVKAAANTEQHGLVPVLACRISWAPFRELVPVVDVVVDVEHSFPAEDIAHVARGLRTAALRLERMAVEAIRLRGEVT